MDDSQQDKRVAQSLVPPTIPEENGKVVLITGVTKGLGRALALEMAARGHVVVGCGRNASTLASLEAQLAGGSFKHLLKIANVASASSVQEFAKLVIEAAGVPDIVVNNAAIINRGAKFWEVPTAEFDSVIDINVKGTANIMKHFLPHMVERKSGVIVNFSSALGHVVSPEFVPYCTSKWALEGLSKAVASEVPNGMAVVSLDPGIIKTEMLESCFGDASKNFPAPDEWAPNAARVILGLTAKDNGASLTLDERTYPADFVRSSNLTVIAPPPVE